MKKKIFLIIGLLAILLAFLVNFHVIRIVSLIIGILFITFQVWHNNPSKKILAFITIIVLIISSYALDYLLLVKFKKAPIYSYIVKSSDKVKVYNSFFYRAYSCDKKIILDYGHNKAYACNVDDLEEQDINAFLSETLKSFKTYHNKFIKLNGKISKISGLDIIELSAYKRTADSLNGYVSFNTDYTVRLKTTADLSKYKIYDSITVIGLVSAIEQKDETYLITMSDTVIIPSEIYNNFTIDILENDSKEPVVFVDKTNYYALGLSNIFVHYDQETIYELSYLISDERIALKDLISDTKPKELKNEEEEIVALEYRLEKFDVLKCEQKDKVIFASKKSKLKQSLCD